MDSTFPSRSVVHDALRLFAKRSRKNGRIHGVSKRGMLIFARTLSRCQTSSLCTLLPSSQANVPRLFLETVTLTSTSMRESRSECCPRCEGDGGGRQYETIEHVLFVCPYYADVRLRLHCDAHLTAWSSTVQEFFLDKDILRMLIQFTKNCGRF